MLMEPTRTDVVVVDDDQNILDFVCFVLSDIGLACELCQQSTNAYQRVLDTQPRLVMLDYQMPALTGAQVFGLLRADPVTLAIPVIFSTGTPDLLRADVPDYEAQGARLLAKPYGYAGLVTTVQTVLASRP